jgi:hypothetical protein
MAVIVAAPAVVDQRLKSGNLIAIDEAFTPRPVKCR